MEYNLSTWDQLKFVGAGPAERMETKAKRIQTK